MTSFSKRLDTSSPGTTWKSTVKISWTSRNRCTYSVVTFCAIELYADAPRPTSSLIKINRQLLWKLTRFPCWLVANSSLPRSNNAFEAEHPLELAVRGRGRAEKGMCGIFMSVSKLMSTLVVDPLSPHGNGTFKRFLSVFLSLSLSLSLGLTQPASYVSEPSNKALFVPGKTYPSIMDVVRVNAHKKFVISNSSNRQQIW